MPDAATEFVDLLKHRDLFRNLVERDLKVRYKRSLLGFFWVFLNPLFMMIVLYVVFSEMFRFSTENYVAYLLSGIVFWNFYSQSTSAAMTSFVGNSDLLKKVYLPKPIFPLSVVASALINLLFSLIPLLLIFFAVGTAIDRNIYLLPLVLLETTIFAYGVSLLLSTLLVFFRDIQYIYEVMLLAWMYATPIFYPESIVPERFRVIFYLNPLHYFLSAFRRTLFMDQAGLGRTLLATGLMSLASLAVGWAFYSRFKDRIIYRM